MTNSSKKESDQHSIREKGESCINDVILERMGESVENNHLFVCLLLALGAILQCCHFLVGRRGGQKVIKCEGGGRVSQKVTNSSKKVTSTVLERKGSHA